MIVPATSRRAGLVAGALAAVVVAVVVGIWALARDDATPPGDAGAASRFVVELDPATGAERKRVAYPAPGRPKIASFGTSMAAGQGGVWIEDPTAYAPTVVSVDARNGEVRPVIVRTGSGSFSLSLATGFDAVWVSTDQLIKINPATLAHRVVLQIPLPIGGSGGSSLAVDGKHLWIGTTGGLLLRIDPRGRSQKSDGWPTASSWSLRAPDGVWVVDQFAGAVVRIDPESLRTVGDPVRSPGASTRSR